MCKLGTEIPIRKDSSALKAVAPCRRQVATSPRASEDASAALPAAAKRCNAAGASTAVAPLPNSSRRTAVSGSGDQPKAPVPAESSDRLPTAGSTGSQWAGRHSKSGDCIVRSEAASTALAKGNGSGALTAPRAVCERFSARIYYKGDYIIRCGAKTTVGFKSLWAMEHYYKCYCCKDCRECRQYSEGRQ